MVTIIAIIVIVVLVVVFSGKKKATSPSPIRSYDHNPNVTPSTGRRLDTKDWKVSVSMPNYKNIIEDSIIDVTGQSYSLNKRLKKYEGGVPYWPHHYVYSYSEINSASSSQKRFYSIYKKEFLNDEFLDLEGNTNYAFILLFDFLEEYDIHRNSTESEKRITALVKYYTKTEPYGIPFLIKRMQSHGDYEGISRLKRDQNHSYQGYSGDSDSWKLGTKYKTILNLNEEQIQLLNKLWTPINNFCCIEKCRIELIKLFLATVEELENYYKQTNTTLQAEFTSVADVIAKKQYRYRAGSENYKYSIDSAINEFYAFIFKMSENALREGYGHKRKINTEISYVPNAKQEFEIKILTPVSQVLSKTLLAVAQPDESTEIELNSMNTSRWKDSFEKMISTYEGNELKFYDKIVSLGKLNKQNPSIENIFFDASKFVAKYDKETSLKLYIHYIFLDLQSKTFDNKQLTKTIQKSLFKTNEQLHEFEIILSDLIKNKELNTALEKVSQIYSIKRKRIKLNVESIKEVQQQHVGTVELLNEYLQDEYEDETNAIKAHQVNSDEVQIDITQKSTEIRHSIYRSDLRLTPIQEATLEFFVKSSFTVSPHELETFTKSYGAFKNQLIESINEICYGSLDDVLIEEEDQSYMINENYYQQLLAV